MNNERIEHLVARLRESGCRITPQRLAILHLLVESTAHPSAQDIYEALHLTYPTMSLATVYKTLNTLKEMGEVAELEVGMGEARYDANIADVHAHFICIRCGSVSDFMAPELIALTQETASRATQRVTGYRVDFFGICAACAHSPE